MKNSGYHLRHADLLEVDRGQLEYLGAAILGLAVDMLLVLADVALVALIRATAEIAARIAGHTARLQGQTAFGFGQQVAGSTVEGCAGWADLGARRVVTILVAMSAEFAFADLAGR